EVVIGVRLGTRLGALAVAGLALADARVVQIEIAPAFRVAIEAPAGPLAGFAAAEAAFALRVVIRLRTVVRRAVGFAALAIAQAVLIARRPGVVVAPIRLIEPAALAAGTAAVTNGAAPPAIALGIMTRTARIVPP